MTANTCGNSKPTTSHTALCIGQRCDQSLRILFFDPLYEEDFEPSNPIFSSAINAESLVGKFFREDRTSEPEDRKLVAIAPPIEVKQKNGELLLKLPVVVPPSFDTDLDLHYKHSNELVVCSPVFNCNVVFSLPLTNADPSCSALPTGPDLLLSRTRFLPGVLYEAWVSISVGKITPSHPRMYQKLGRVVTSEEVSTVTDVDAIIEKYSCLLKQWCAQHGVVVQIKGTSCVILQLSIKITTSQGPCPLQLGDCVEFFAISISSNYNLVKMAISCRKLGTLLKPIDAAAGLFEFAFRFQPDRYSYNVYTVPRLGLLSDPRKKLAELAINKLDNKNVVVSLLCDANLETGKVNWEIVDLLATAIESDKMSTRSCSSSDAPTSSSKVSYTSDQMRAIANELDMQEDISSQTLPSNKSPPSSSGSSWMSPDGDRTSTSASTSSKPASSKSRGFNFEVDEEDEAFGSDDSSSSTPPCLPVEQDAMFTNLSSKAVIFQFKGHEVVVLVLDEQNFKWKKLWTKKHLFPNIGALGQCHLYPKIINGKVNFRASVTQYPSKNDKKQYKCDFGTVDIDVPGTIELFNRCYLLKVAVWCTISDLHPHMFALTELCPCEDKTITETKPKPIVTRESVGVVCVKLSSQLFHVFSIHFAAELMLIAEDTLEAEEDKQQLDLGQWLQFSAREQDGIWMIFSFKLMYKPGYYTLPCLGKIYMECKVTVPENYAASKGKLHLKAEFGNRVMDDKQLLKGKKSTIRALFSPPQLLTAIRRISCLDTGVWSTSNAYSVINVVMQSNLF
uniref:Uncharacterized protein n=1 Tax=Ditylenchus dipsaci TaxID=166011 RepID=A0A915DR34_9BILA